MSSVNGLICLALEEKRLLSANQIYALRKKTLYGKARHVAYDKRWL
jgi:hypothetical protein